MSEKPVGRLTLNGVDIPLATSPYIGVNGNFWTWNTSTQEYVDSGVPATVRGNQGPQGISIKNTAAVVDEDGRLTFTLLDPANNGRESALTTSTSVQGVGISDIAVVETEGDDKGKIQFTLTDPKNNTSRTIVSGDNVIPTCTWDNEAHTLTVNVGGQDYTSESLQGIQGFQGINIDDITVNAQGQLVITFIDPATGAAPVTPTTLTTERVVPICTWDNTNHTLTISVGGNDYTSDNLQGIQGIQGIQGYQGIYVSSGEVDTSGHLTFHLTDPAGTTPEDIEIEGYFTGPQGKNITDILVTDDYRLQFTLYDPATDTSSTLTTTDEIQPTSVNNVAPIGNNVTITGSDIAVSSSDDTSIATKIANMASVTVRSTSPSAASPAPTSAEKLGLWVDRTTGLSYVYDEDNTTWITLGAVWK